MHVDRQAVREYVWLRVCVCVLVCLCVCVSHFPVDLFYSLVF